MEFVRNTVGFMALVLRFMYAFWPFILTAPLARYRRNLLGGMTALWLFMLLGLLASVAMGEEPVTVLIPEPLNTYMFFGTGLVLLGLVIARRLYRRRALEMTADKARSPDDLLSLSAAQFEEMVVEFYKHKGAKAWRTGATGDHGVDVVVETPKGEKWVVQCKRWRGSVGEPQLRDFYGAMQHEKADRGVLVTTGTFSNAARTWAQGKPLVLADGRGFLKAWKDARKN